jgi:hypothetical protein
MCKEWSEDGAQGLREKRLDEADATLGSFIGPVVTVAPSLASDQQEDAAFRTGLNNA